MDRLMQTIFQEEDGPLSLYSHFIEVQESSGIEEGEEDERTMIEDFQA